MKRLLIGAFLLAMTSLASAQQSPYNKVASGQISVSSTATLIVPARNGRAQLTLEQLGTTEVFIGNSTVTTSTGISMSTTKYTTIELPSGAAVYGITSSSTDTIGYLEAY